MLSSSNRTRIRLDRRRTARRIASRGMIGDHFSRKQNITAVRHVTGDRLVAVIELVSKRQQIGPQIARGFSSARPRDS